MKPTIFSRENFFLLYIFLALPNLLSAAECTLDYLDESNPLELFEEREHILSNIAWNTAKFLDVPLFPDHLSHNEYLELMTNPLIKVVQAERNYKTGFIKAEASQGNAKRLIQLVTELLDIQREFNNSVREMVNFSTFSAAKSPPFLEFFELYLRNKEADANEILSVLRDRLVASEQLSQTIILPRRAIHASLVLGVSTTKYKRVTKSPLYFTYTYSQRGWAPKFGVELATGHNGFRFTDPVLQQAFKKEIVLHPEHPNHPNGIDGRVTFQWEGAIVMLQGSINHFARFGTGGFSILPIAFSIGPEFTPKINSQDIKIKHDTWAFYKLLGIDKKINL